MAKNRFKTFILNFLKNTRFRAIGFCLTFSFLLWVFITFSDYRQHDFRIPIVFENSLKPDEIYNTRDSVIIVKVKATGFDFLFRSGFETKKEQLHFDINNLPIDVAKGEMKFASEFLKASVTESLGMEKLSVSILPDTIYLNWQKKYSKTIPVINRTVFECKPSYRMIKEPELIVNKVKVEGEKELLDNLDTLYTKAINIANIDKTHISLIPIEITQQYQGLYFQPTNIPIKIDVEEVTENVVELPVNIVRQGIEEDVKLFPSKAKVKYRLPIKDYKNVNPENFYIYVLCEEDIQNKKKLRVKYSNIPNNVEILDINPGRLDYIIVNE